MDKISYQFADHTYLAFNKTINIKVYIYKYINNGQMILVAKIDTSHRQRNALTFSVAQ